MGIRKNAASLTTTERKKFIDAIMHLKNTGVYDQFVAIHEGVTSLAGRATRDGAHSGPAFLPWHREYLLRFEKQLQAFDPDVSIPYWKWDSGVPTDTTSIFVDEFMGPPGTGTGDVGPITTGFLAESLNSFNPNGWKVHDSLHMGVPGTVIRRRTTLDPLQTSSFYRLAIGAMSQKEGKHLENYSNYPADLNFRLWMCFQLGL